MMNESSGELNLFAGVELMPTKLDQDYEQEMQEKQRAEEEKVRQVCLGPRCPPLPAFDDCFPLSSLSSLSSLFPLSLLFSFALIVSFSMDDITSAALCPLNPSGVTDEVT